MALSNLRKNRRTAIALRDSGPLPDEE